MWRYPVWKRTVVMAGGCVANVAFGMALLSGLFAFVPLADDGRLQREPVRVATVPDPASAAAQLGLRPGDTITRDRRPGRPRLGQPHDHGTGVRRSPRRRVAVTFDRDGVGQVGIVAGPHPGVVFVEGSGPE
jgi:hypothetical protein